MTAQQNAENKTFCLWHLEHVPGVIIRNEKWKIYFHFSATTTISVTVATTTSGTKSITRTTTASDHLAIIYVNCNEAGATFITLSLCLSISVSSQSRVCHPLFVATIVALLSLLLPGLWQGCTRDSRPETQCEAMGPWFFRGNLKKYI